MSGVQKGVLGFLVVLVAGLGAIVGYRVWDDQRDHRDYPSSVRDGFLVGCASTGVDDSRCGCALDEIEEALSLQRYLAVERNYVVTGTYPPSFSALTEAPCGVRFADTPTSSDDSTPATAAPDLEVVDIVEHANSEAATLEPGLLCRDVADRGFDFATAYAYWVSEGVPDRMDQDDNGVPCETIYPVDEVEAYLELTTVTG